ncbi:MAG: FHA domain-containing protein [Pirellulales bacterium]|jgi:pSer/pThr/pTyr-binding forkhead associated (FHA) protein
MASKLGELVPVGGGDPIPLLKEELMIGRREECDIILRFKNVSSNHCQLYVKHGYWFIKDENSRNGTKVNGKRLESEKRLDPADTISIAKHDYQVSYDPVNLGAVGPPPAEESVVNEILSQSLLEKIGIGSSRRRS